MSAPLALALAVTLVAALRDWRTGHIPDWLTLPTMGAAPFVHVALASSRGASVHQAALAACYAVLGGLLCGLVPVVLYRRGALGGGDVKLFVALGALCRPMLGLELEAYGFVAAALLAPMALLYEGRLLQTVRNAAWLLVNPLLPAVRRRDVDRNGMSSYRMGPAIALGAMAAAVLRWGRP